MFFSRVTCSFQNTSKLLQKTADVGRGVGRAFKFLDSAWDHSRDVGHYRRQVVALSTGKSPVRDSDDVRPCRLPKAK